MTDNVQPGKIMPADDKGVYPAETGPAQDTVDTRGPVAAPTNHQERKLQKRALDPRRTVTHGELDRYMTSFAELLSQDLGQGLEMAIRSIRTETSALVHTLAHVTGKDLDHVKQVYEEKLDVVREEFLKQLQGVTAHVQGAPVEPGDLGSDPSTLKESECYPDEAQVQGYPGKPLNPDQEARGE